MTKEQLKKFLVSLFPNFESAWNDPQNYFKENNGDYTYHGLFSEFSHYFRDHFTDFNENQLWELFQSIERWHVPEEGITGDVSDELILSNAAFTCFLENIASEGLTESLKKFMGPKSFDYYSHYDH